MASQQQDLRQIYHHIIDDVVAKMKPGFLQESVDESVLQTIRQRWAQKLLDKGIISEPEAQPEPVAVKKDEDSQSSRKRPYDGSAPNNRQEAAAAAAGAAAGAPALNMPMKGPPHMMLQHRPAMQAVNAGVPGMRPAHPHNQLPMGRNMTAAQAGLAAVAAAAAQQQQQHPGLPQGLLQQAPGQQSMMLSNAIASVQHLPQAQQTQVLQAHLQQLHRNQMRPQALAAGMPGQPQISGMPANQALAAGQQLQNMAALRPQGVPQQALPQQVLQQQGLQQQQALQHHVLQQQALQQGLRMPNMPPGMQQGVPAANLQELLPPNLLQQRIPQGDGSADLPPSVEEVAAAAGMQPQQLRAILPQRIAAIMDRGSAGDSSKSSTSGRPRASTPVPSAPAALAATAPADRPIGTGAGSKPRQHRCSRHIIPQLDGEDDDDEEDYVGDNEADGEDAGDVEEGDEEEEADAEADEDSDESDDPEMAKFTAEMDAAEEADKLESGDVGFALYEKVHRAKNRWRCSLRYGVFLINGKEYMFNKGSTDFTF